MTLSVTINEIKQLLNTAKEQAIVAELENECKSELDLCACVRVLASMDRYALKTALRKELLIEKSKNKHLEDKIAYLESIITKFSGLTTQSITISIVFHFLTKSKGRNYTC